MKNSHGEVKQFILETEGRISEQLLMLSKRAFELGIKSSLVPKNGSWRAADCLELETQLKGQYVFIYVYANDFISMIKCEEFLNSYPALLDESRNWQLMEDQKAEEEKRLKELEDAMLDGPLPVPASAFSELTF